MARVGAGTERALSSGAVRSGSHAWTSHYIHAPVLLKDSLVLDPVPKRVGKGSLVITGRMIGNNSALRVYRELDCGFARSIPLTWRGSRFRAVLSFGKKGRYTVEIVTKHRVWDWRVAAIFDISVAGGKVGFRDRALAGLPEDRSRSLGEAERTYFGLLNLLRKRLGLPPFIWSERLARISRRHSRVCLKHGTFAHSTPWDGTVQSRSRAAGFAFSLGENISAGYNARQAICGLFRSIAHRISMISPGFTHCGIGAVRKPNGLYFYTIMYESRGLERFTQKRYRSAIQYLGREFRGWESLGCRAGAGQGNALMIAGYAYYYLKDYRRANQYLIQALRWKKDEKHIHVMIADGYYKMKRYRKMLAYSLKGLALEPRNFTLLQFVALAHYYLKRYDEAEAAIRRALSVKPGNQGMKRLLRAARYYRRRSRR